MLNWRYLPVRGRSCRGDRIHLHPLIHRGDSSKRQFKQGALLNWGPDLGYRRRILNKNICIRTIYKYQTLKLKISLSTPYHHNSCLKNRTLPAGSVIFIPPEPQRIGFALRNSNSSSRE